MFKKPFFGLCKPRLRYATTGESEKDGIKEIPLPEKVTLLVEQSLSFIHDDLIVKSGDRIKTGQKIHTSKDGKGFIISTVTGSIDSISGFTGYLGKKYLSISIATDKEDQIDEAFTTAVKSVSLPDAFEFIQLLPGCSGFGAILYPETPLHTLVINGFDRDLLVKTNQNIILSRAEDLRKGVRFLKEITKSRKIIITVPDELKFSAEKLGVEVKVIKSCYPDALPEMIMKKVLGKIVPAGKSCLELGVAFISPETVASLATAFDQKKMPVMKNLTVIDKNQTTINVSARIGTPVRNIFKELNMEVKEGDRIVQGGPMTGVSLYSEDMPVLFDTDSLMVQDKDQVVSTSDNPCVNCGECVRVCPSRIQVNMLIRLLENALYKEAAEEYDLLSCIECGLCAFVCEARIPVFHYILLGKQEFYRLKIAEEHNNV